jgi:hypothetical protein
MRAHDNRSAKALVLRIDRVFAEMNASLLAVAIALVALDATYLVATRYVDFVPQLTNTALGAELAVPGGSVASAR